MMCLFLRASIECRTSFESRASFMWAREVAGEVRGESVGGGAENGRKSGKS